MHLLPAGLRLAQDWKSLRIRNDGRNCRPTETGLAEKIEVRMWYVGLGSLELHLERIRARVARGGHDIPEPRVRQRYQQGILNLIDLLPLITELLVYDNSEEADPN